jgi:hypothetical protein
MYVEILLTEYLYMKVEKVCSWAAVWALHNNKHRSLARTFSSSRTLFPSFRETDVTK